MFPLHEPLDANIRQQLSEYDDLIAALLARRGITTPEEAVSFLKPSYDSHLHDPLLMTDMEKAAQRLAVAIQSEQRIAIWSDYDSDGIPGGVLMHDFLKKCGADFENYIPHRHLEGYGLNENGINKLSERGAKLLITIDSGITDLKAVERANELGMDVIITDHHLPAGSGLPNAYAVVNPSARPDEKYPFLKLCGAAVAWKLVCAVLAVSPELRAKVPAGQEKWLLDMVGLATVADMVPMLGENRVLARFGLLVLRKSPRIGLQRLCRTMRTDQRNLTEDDIGFMLAPRVNAASRMGEARDVFNLFTTEDESEADALAKKLEKVNRERRAAAGAITRAVHTRLKERESIPSVIVIGDPDWRPGLLGLVANNISEEYARPVFLWGREGNMSIKGSVRSGGSAHVLELMGLTKECFVEYGGHAASGGFTAHESAIFTLEEKLAEAYERSRGTVSDPFVCRADALISLEEISEELLAKVNRLAPFGMENPKPLFLLRSVPVLKISSFGKANEHLKLIIGSENSAKEMEGVAFFAARGIGRNAASLFPGAKINAIAYLERDSFSRRNPVRLRLLDLRLV